MTRPGGSACKRESPPSARQPYVGYASFTHKAGLHVAAVVKQDWSYQHIDPALVGNEMRVVVSELAGRRIAVTAERDRERIVALTGDENRTPPTC